MNATQRQELLERFAEHVPPSSRPDYLLPARQFLAFCGRREPGEALRAFVGHLLDEGYSPNTIRRRYVPALRKLFRVQGWEWSLRPWELPQVSERDIYAPALAPEVLRRMVDAAKEGRLRPKEAQLLCLATVYGLRREELASIGPDEVDLERRLLFVRTVKRGRERWHLIPEPIVPYLAQGLDVRYTPGAVSAAWYRIEEASGVGRLPEAGWHSIRRALVRELVMAGLPEPVIHNFLRWKRHSGNMVAHYFSTTVVGLGGVVQREPGREDREVDEQVFRAHPFLAWWGEG